MVYPMIFESAIYDEKNEELFYNKISNKKAVNLRFVLQYTKSLLVMEYYAHFVRYQ